MAEICELLKEQAEEIAKEGHNGWGNTMLDASVTITRLEQELEGYKNEGQTLYEQIFTEGEV